MQAPPNMGKDYTEKFRAIFPRLAKKNSITLIPFLLEGVAGNPNLNLPDGIHPTAEGHRLIAQTVWSTLNPVLTRTIEAHRK
jgi:acyl-CoA thioesterase-1